MSKIVTMLAACLLLACTADADRAAETDVSAGVLRDNIGDYYGFDEIEIIKLDWGIDNLLISDFSNDGLKDIAIANNRRSRIEFLIQRQTPEAAAVSVAVNPADIDINELPGTSQFGKQDLPVTQRIFSMVCGDLNSDGLTDIAFYGEPMGLYVILRRKDAEDGTLGWHNHRRIRIEDGQRNRLALICADLDQDGRMDLAMAGQDTIHIVFQKPDGTLAEPVKYPTTAAPLVLKSADLNGDGIPDLIYSTSDSDRPLHVRFGLPGGRLGPQMAFTMDHPLPYTLQAFDYDASGKAGLVMIDAASGRLNSYELVEGQSGDVDECSILVYPLESSKDSARRDLVVADVDGSGRKDVVVSDPASAELILYRQLEGIGLDRPETFPSVAGVTTLASADLDGNGGDEIAVLSVTERTIGISRFVDGRLTFPVRMELDGEPLAMDIADIDGDGKIDCGYVAKDANDTRFFGIIDNLQLTTGTRPVSNRPTVPLKRLQTNPEGLKLLDVNGDGLRDVLILVQWESPMLLLQTSSGGFVEISPEDSQAAILREATMRSISPAPPVGERGNLMLAQRNFARSLKVDSAGKWQIVDQFNARSSENVISAAASFDIDNDGTAELLLLDGARGRLQILRATAEGNYRFEKEYDVGTWNIRRMLFAPLRGNAEKDILLFDGAKFALVSPPGRGGPMLQLAREF
ncbi:MAG TPA: VCBS repeat-containing protein, partial [Sedimentisphaerales bacterium]|nr:VCBS repeat-containing protein [Sedimentisphaerales bacterium]